MLISAVFLPGAPVLVPEVSGPGVPDAEPVRAAVRTAVTEHAGPATAWWALAPDSTVRPQAGAADLTGVGSFGGFGVDRRVRLGPGETAEPPAPWPTALLIAGWAREFIPGEASVRPLPVAPGDDQEACRVRGGELGAELAADAGDVALLVVGDGAIHLDMRAPGGGLEPDAVALQAEIDAALASGDPAALAALDWDRCRRWGVSGRPVWEVLAAAAPGPASVTVGYVGAPFGVGYDVLTWRFG